MESILTSRVLMANYTVAIAMVTLFEVSNSPEFRLEHASYGLCLRRIFRVVVKVKSVRLTSDSAIYSHKHHRQLHPFVPAAGYQATLPPNQLRLCVLRQAGTQNGTGS